MNERLPRIAITHGDPNGIGYEIILKILEDNRILELCTPVLYGSQKIASQYRKLLGLPNIPMTHITEAGNLHEGAAYIINVVPEEFKAEPGNASSQSGAAALASLERAVADLKAGLVDAIVTAPICKSTIQNDSFNFPGHTEYLQAQMNDDSEDGENNRQALMILCNDRLRVALATTHLPLAAIAPAVTKELVIDKALAFNRSLHYDFGVNAPRIAVLALNPHAGDNGLLGSEEQEIISPAITELRQKHRVLAFGPYAADGFFGSGAYEKFDGVLAMYHDQGLAPFKTLAMDAGVNVTAGLSIVRTSPDHGTGFDIAGKGQANEESMRQAIYTAIDILRNRKRDDRAHRHPLRKQYYEKGNDNVVLDLS
ncbi:MAG: 4-hydroxythreonine-4-phosphate dehydrogenase PdxA [Muribaculaceae bacterium]|nr:4-hydroxythreonine-4-phosphate dehydrogenase PdxA [Muribaculaceae bacterium]